MPTPLDEVLSRLNAQGATSSNNGLPNYLILTNSEGQVDTSLFESSIAFHQVSDLTEITSPSLGAIAVVNNTASYVCTDATTPTWLLFSQLNASGINFTPANGLVSTNVQAAISELALNVISASLDSNVSSNLTFDTGAAPFIIGASSLGHLVTGLNAELLNGHNSAYYLNASNITSGTLPTARLSGTYPISISGWAANAYLANTVSGLDVARLNTGTGSSRLATNLFSTSAVYPINVSGNAGTATTATNLNGEAASFYLNPANFTGGVLPSAVFNDTSHGNRGGGDLHATAIPSGSSDAAAGFISANDQAKLNTISAYAEPNQNTWSYIKINNDSEPSLTAPNSAATLIIKPGSLNNIIIGSDNDTQTITIDADFGNILDSLTTLTLASLSGGGLKLVAADYQGKLVYGSGKSDSTHTPAITTDILPQGIDNLYASPTNVLAALDPAQGALLAKDTGSNKSVEWTVAGNKIYGYVNDLTTDDIIVGAAKFLTHSGLNPFLTNTDGSVSIDRSGSTFDFSVNPTKALVRTGTNAFVDANLSLGVKTLNVTTGTPGTAAGTGYFDNLVSNHTFHSGDDDKTVATVGYVGSVLVGATDAAYRLPIRTLADTNTAKPYELAIGEVVVDGSNYYVVNTYQTTYTTGNVLPVTGTITGDEVSSGGISSVMFGNLLKLSNLVESPAAAQVFCPTLLLSEPLAFTHSYDAEGTNSFTNTNWKKYNKKSIQVRGKKGVDYLVVLKVDGFVSKNHQWNLKYYTNNGTLVTLPINVADNVQQQDHSRDGQWHPSDSFTKIDNTRYAILVPGQSTVSLEYIAYDGLFTIPQSGVNFPGLPPYTTDNSKPAPNSGFASITPLAVWSAATNEPFTPNIPDYFSLLSEGEIISGGISSYTADASQDKRAYDGEPIVDNQGNVTGYTVDSTGDFIKYSPTTNLDTAVAFDKPWTRSSPANRNKQFGINGFLRSSTVVVSGPRISKAIALTEEDAAGLTISQLNSRLAIPIGTVLGASTTLKVLGTNVTVPNTTLIGDLSAAFHTQLDFGCTTGEPPVDTQPVFALNYSPDTDRFTFSVTCGGTASTLGDLAKAYFPESDDFLHNLRLGFGRTSAGEALSLPVASGIKLNQSVLSNTINLASIPFIYTGATGSYSVDDKVFTYTNADTITSIADTLAIDGYLLHYEFEGNCLVLDRLPGFFGDATSLVAPRVYDLNGNLMECLGLAKDSHGNANLAPQAIHNILYTDHGLYVTGDFRSYNGTTSPGIAKIKLDGTYDSLFNVGAGFSSPTYAISAVPSSKDIVVAPLEAASFNGWAPRSVYRLTETGAESSINPTTECPVSEDAQDKVLGVIVVSDSVKLILTPRKLIADCPGHTYPRVEAVATKALTGMRLLYNNGTDVAIVVTSTVSSSQGNPQDIVLSNVGLGGEAHTTIPSGIKLIIYNISGQNFRLANAWGGFSGTGAMASCAYPVIGGITYDPLTNEPNYQNAYVVAGNNAAYWNSGKTDSSNNLDWSWNCPQDGNLLLWSDDLTHSDEWVPTYCTTAGGDYLDTHYTTITDNSSSIAYLSQIYTLAPNFVAFTDNVPHSLGNVGLQYIVVVELNQNVDIGKNLDDSYYSYISLTINGTTAVGVTLNNNSRGLKDVGGENKRFFKHLPTSGWDADVYEEFDGTGVAVRAYVSLWGTDTITSSHAVEVSIHPAYATGLNNTNAQDIAQGSINVVKTDLRFSNLWTWQRWAGDIEQFKSKVYVHTEGTRKLPANPADGTNSNDFQGLYKIGLDNSTAITGPAANLNGGRQYPSDFAVKFELLEPESHAIPFAVDSHDNIYVGGPITKIYDHSAQPHNVAPWRLYKLQPNGDYDYTDPFNVNAVFNDKVTSCTIDPYNHVIVGGTFTAYNKRPAGGLVFLNSLGEVLDNIDPYAHDVIESQTAPTDPDTFNKLWLSHDVITDAPILHIYDPELVNGSPVGWVNLLSLKPTLYKPVIKLNDATNPTLINLELDLRDATRQLVETNTQATVIKNGEVTSIILLNGGSGYSSSPTVNIVAADGGMGATAHALVYGGHIMKIVLDSGGSDYLASPTIEISDSTGLGATAISTISTGVDTDGQNDVNIYYTFDGVTVANGSVYWNTTPILYDPHHPIVPVVVGGTETIQTIHAQVVPTDAMANGTQTQSSSPISSATYTIKPRVTAPVVHVTSGTFTFTKTDYNNLTSTTKVLYYLVDGVNGPVPSAVTNPPGNYVAALAAGWIDITGSSFAVTYSATVYAMSFAIYSDAFGTHDRTTPSVVANAAYSIGTASVVVTKTIDGSVTTGTYPGRPQSGAFNSTVNNNKIHLSNSLNTGYTLYSFNHQVPPILANASAIQGYYQQLSVAQPTDILLDSTFVNNNFLDGVPVLTDPTHPLSIFGTPDISGVYIYGLTPNQAYVGTVLDSTTLTAPASPLIISVTADNNGQVTNTNTSLVIQHGSDYISLNEVILVGGSSTKNVSISNLVVQDRTIAISAAAVTKHGSNYVDQGPIAYAYYQLAPSPIFTTDADSVEYSLTKGVSTDVYFKPLSGSDLKLYYVFAQPDIWELDYQIGNTTSTGALTTVTLNSSIHSGSTYNNFQMLAFVVDVASTPTHFPSREFFNWARPFIQWGPGGPSITPVNDSVYGISGVNLSLAGTGVIYQYSFCATPAIADATPGGWITTGSLSDGTFGTEKFVSFGSDNPHIPTGTATITFIAKGYDQYGLFGTRSTTFSKPIISTAAALPVLLSQTDSGALVHNGTTYNTITYKPGSTDSTRLFRITTGTTDKLLHSSSDFTVVATWDSYNSGGVTILPSILDVTNSTNFTDAKFYTYSAAGSGAYPSFQPTLGDINDGKGALQMAIRLYEPNKLPSDIITYKGIGFAIPPPGIETVAVDTNNLVLSGQITGAATYTNSTTYTITGGSHTISKGSGNWVINDGTHTWSKHWALYPGSSVFSDGYGPGDVAGTYLKDGGTRTELITVSYVNVSDSQGADGVGEVSVNIIGPSNVPIFYSLNGEEPSTSTNQFFGKLLIKSSCTVKAVAIFYDTDTGGSYWNWKLNPGQITDTHITDIASHDVSIRNFTGDERLSMINIYFGQVNNEFYQTNITGGKLFKVGAPAPIGNMLLNPSYSRGFPVQNNTVSPYWNVVNTSYYNISRAVPLRDIFGSGNSNNSLNVITNNITSLVSFPSQPGLYYDTTANQAIFDIVSPGRTPVTSDRNTTLAEITGLLPKNYLLVATVLDPNCILDIQGLGVGSGTICLSNDNDSSCPAFFGIGQQAGLAGSIGDSTTLDTITRIAMIKPDGSGVPMNFTIFGSHIVTLQLIEVEEFIQPALNQIVGSDYRDGRQLTISVPNGNYCLMYLHGAVTTSTLTNTYLTDNYVLQYEEDGDTKYVRVNTDDSNFNISLGMADGLGGSSGGITTLPALRFPNYETAVNYYFGNSYFLHQTGGSVSLQFSPGTDSNIALDKISIAPNSTYKYPPYIAYGVSYNHAYLNASNSNGQLQYNAVNNVDNTDARSVIPPVFALISMDKILNHGDYARPYLYPPIILPGTCAIGKISSSPYNNKVTMFSYSEGDVFYSESLGIETQPITPTSSFTSHALVTNRGTSLPTYSGLIRKAMVSEVISGTRYYSPVTTAKYSGNATTIASTGTATIGWKAEDATTTSIAVTEGSVPSINTAAITQTASGSSSGNAAIIADDMNLTLVDYRRFGGSAFMIPLSADTTTAAALSSFKLWAVRDNPIQSVAQILAYGAIQAEPTWLTIRALSQPPIFDVSMASTPDGSVSITSSDYGYLYDTTISLPTVNVTTPGQAWAVCDIDSTGAVTGTFSASYLGTSYDSVADSAIVATCVDASPTGDHATFNVAVTSTAVVITVNHAGSGYMVPPKVIVTAPAASPTGPIGGGTFAAYTNASAQLATSGLVGRVSASTVDAGAGYDNVPLVWVTPTTRVLYTAQQNPGNCPLGTAILAGYNSVATSSNYNSIWMLRPSGTYGWVPVFAGYTYVDVPIYTSPALAYRIDVAALLNGVMVDKTGSTSFVITPGSQLILWVEVSTGPNTVVAVDDASPDPLANITMNLTFAS